MFKKFILFVLIISLPIAVFAEELSEEDAFLVAKNAYDDGSYGVSLNLFQKFINDFPDSQANTEARLYIAQCFFQNNKFIEARDILTKLEKSYVSYGIEDRFLYWSGQVYLKVKDYKEAAKYFKKMVEMHPNSSLLFETKMLLGWVFLQDGKYDEAEQIFDTLTRSEDNAIQEEALFKKGEALFQKKDYNGVLENYTIFTKVFPDSDKLTKVYFYMGDANFYLDNFDKAISYYSMALEKTDDNWLKAASLQGEAWSYLKQNKLKESQDAFSRIDGLEVKNFNKENFYFGKATLYYRLNRLDEALNYYNELIKMYPRSDMIIQVLFGKAECLVGLSRLEEATDAYLKVIYRAGKIDDKETKEIVVKAHYNLGRIYLKTEDPRSALGEFQKAIALSNDDQIKLSSLYELGGIYQNRQEFDKAIDVYTRILKDYPYNSYNDYVWYQLSLVYLKLGKTETAISSLREFNKKFTQSELLDEVNYYLGYAYFKNNEFKESCNQLQKFLDAFPDSPYRDRASYLLAVSFNNRGMFKEAIDNFEKVLKEFAQNKDLAEKSDYAVANALYQMGEEKQAISKFKQFTEEYPESSIAPNVIFWLGQYYYENSLFESARNSFETIIQKYPEYNNLVQEARYEIGLTFLAENKLDSATESFSKLLESCNLKQVKLKTMLALGDLFLEQDKRKEAAQMYKDLIQLACSAMDSSIPKTVSKEENKGLELSDFLDYTGEKANTQNPVIATYKSLGKDNNDFANKFIKLAYIKLGDLYREDRNFSDAVYNYRGAMKYLVGESGVELQFKIAECSEESNNIDTSLEEYLKIPYIYGGDRIWAIKGLLRAARIYEDKENWQEAVNIYEKVFDYNVPESKYAKEKIESLRQVIGTKP
ncbi:MAG: tetratricopeptide repeat protein [Candidatus Omnitrophica bacterium]|nr:tetratricopeptide repeat protein [Candidatus Omnitrophota bacterium]MDD5352645.1 tetratricopeptide repeat protein [Candidatus Omnitrophota bacterium]MDD5550244.1 tetratricopeptide repeat protein [Candidatus Omnitrophota bacterium]